MRPRGVRPGWRAVPIALAIVASLSGCGEEPEGARPTPGSRSEVTASPLPAVPALPAATNGVRVLYDGAWLVEEGQWWLGSTEAYFDRGDIPTFRRILESVNSGSVSITIPAADGRYRSRVELSDVAPLVTDWCEDAGEASLEVPVGRRAITMGSLESSRELPVPEPGWYRVRYCAEKQDRAAAEDAFVGDDHATYTGRHLIQVWPAPRATDRVLRQGSDWVRRLHSGRWR